MSITVVSAPSTPTLPTATGSDVSAAGQDFANLLLGQLTTTPPIAAGQIDLPIADAALASGFYDQSALTRHFKRSFGITPLQYQRAGAAGRAR